MKSVTFQRNVTLLDIPLIKNIIHTLQEFSSECQIKIKNNLIIFEILTPKYYFRIESPVEYNIELFNEFHTRVDTKNLLTISKLFKKNDLIKIDFSHDDYITFFINDDKKIKLKKLDIINSDEFTFKSHPISICVFESFVFSNIIKEIKLISESFNVISDSNKVSIEDNDSYFQINDCSFLTFNSHIFKLNQYEIKPLNKILKNYKINISFEYTKECKFIMKNSGTNKFLYVIF